MVNGVSQPGEMGGPRCCCCAPEEPRWFGGADYRQIRTHFSEAVAFATLTLSAGPQGPDLRVTGSELEFDYESSFAVHAGYHLSECVDLRFSYWNLDTDVGVSGAAAAGQVIVDPFGNVASVGSTISTRASVKLDVFDLECLRNMEDPCWPVSAMYSVGVRFADVDQRYASTITGGGALPPSDGVFHVDWFGVGPYASLTGRALAVRNLSLFAKAGSALLVGRNDITTDVTVIGLFTGGQSSGRILVVPVLECELGASWQPNNCFRLSAGWLAQAWFDLGVSGGTFSGQNLPAAGFPALQNVFGGADDSNIMGFDGLFARAEWNY